MKDGFIFHFNNLLELEDLTNEEVGEMFLAMCNYGKSGAEPLFTDRTLKTVWRRLKDRMDTDNEAYEERCRANKENGSKGGRPKKEAEETTDTKTAEKEETEKPNGLQENRMVFEKTEKTERFLEKPKKPDTDSDTDTDIDSDTVTVSDTIFNSIKEKDKREKAAKTAAHSTNADKRSEIIDYLNAKCGTSYRPNTADTIKHVDARLKEGYATDDFKRVIDNMTAEWRNDEKMAGYLRPKTLFGTNFESYLNRVRGKPKNEFLNFQHHDYDLKELARRAKQEAY